MFSIFIISIVFFGVAFYKTWKTSEIEIVEKKGYIHENTKMLNDKSLILDVDVYSVEYIIATYKYKNKEYKIIVDDFFDLNDIKVKNDKHTLKNAVLQSKLNNVNSDVTNVVKKYAGPNDDFYNINQNFRLIFQPVIDDDYSDDWCLILEYDDDFTNFIFI